MADMEWSNDKAMVQPSEAMGHTTENWHDAGQNRDHGVEAMTTAVADQRQQAADRREIEGNELMTAFEDMKDDHPAEAEMIENFQDRQNATLAQNAEVMEEVFEAMQEAIDTLGQRQAQDAADLATRVDQQGSTAALDVEQRAMEARHAEERDALAQMIDECSAVIAEQQDAVLGQMSDTRGVIDQALRCDDTAQRQQALEQAVTDQQRQSEQLNQVLQGAAQEMIDNLRQVATQPANDFDVLA